MSVKCYFMPIKCCNLHLTSVKKFTAAGVLPSWSIIFHEIYLQLGWSLESLNVLFFREAKFEENVFLAVLPLELGEIYFKLLNTSMETCNLHALCRHFSQVDKHLCMVPAQNHTSSKWQSQYFKASIILEASVLTTRF